MTRQNPIIPAASADTQQTPLLCHTCGYQLIGLPREGNCPECSHSIADSRKAGIAEESVAGIACQTLAGVCISILARNLCLFLAAFFHNAAGFYLLLALIFAIVAILALHGAIELARTPQLLKKHPLLIHTPYLWKALLGWPAFIAVIIIGALVKHAVFAFIFILCFHFTVSTLLWAVLFLGLRHRLRSRHHDTANLLFLLAALSFAAVTLITLTIAILFFAKAGNLQMSLYDTLIYTFILGSSFTSLTLGISAWLVSTPSWELKPQD